VDLVALVAIISILSTAGIATYALFTARKTAEQGIQEVASVSEKALRRAKKEETEYRS